MTEEEYKGVWVFVEQTNGEPSTVSWELLSIGADLARDLNVELCTMVIGDTVEHLCQESFAYGASKAYLMDAPMFHYYRTEPYYRAVCYLIDRYKPEVVLVGATSLGKDLAGAVATELQTGLTDGCTELAIDENRLLLQTRPAYSGNIMATIVTERTRPQMATVRPRAMSMPESDTSRTGEIVRESMDISEEDIGVKILEVIDSSKEGTGAVDITSADIIVCGGRGIQSRENFQVLQELANELGGAVAASRAAVEDDLTPMESWVGQSGTTVRPRIYIACGVSGAIQHTAGMRDSDTIIAINFDRQAPIFEVATFGIEGDVLQVVPAITRYVKELRSQK
jgi:electron transfer flavoprotein alpha subunit